MSGMTTTSLASVTNSIWPTRSFLGDYFLVAVYSRAISPDELPGEEFFAVEAWDKLPVTWANIKASLE